ncbi:MAG: capsule assembly Wzi family protein, partial [Gemmatimonadaceae bacterium]
MKLTEPPVRLVSHRSAQSTRYAHGTQPRSERRSLRLAVIFAATVAMIGGGLSAQTVNGPRRIGPIAYPTSDASDQIRLSQLAGDTSHLGAYLVRSPSILLFGDSVLTPHARTLRWLAPDVHSTVNSAIPLSLNEGGMWAGRGASLRVTGGAELSTGRLRVVIAPEFWTTSNARFDQISRKNGYYYFLPSVPMSRNGRGFANRWYAAPYSADLPWRFGSAPMGRLLPGQTGIWYDSGPVEFGVTTENMWWGPGIRNAIIMSDNAAGIPRLEMRTPHPIKTRFGDIEAQWLVGALAESKYFDTTSTNNVRSIAAAVVTWQPVFQPTLTLGVTRAVYATSTGIGPVAFRWFDVFAATGQPANHLPSDSSLTPGGRDQLFSLFGRWLFPDDGFEVYTEWARQELPTSLKDFIIDPTHSHGYT